MPAAEGEDGPDATEQYNDGTSTPVFYKDLQVHTHHLTLPNVDLGRLEEENKKHNPYSAHHIPPNHPATRLPFLDLAFLVDNSGLHPSPPSKGSNERGLLQGPSGT